ncbi:MAG: hypothetical protein ACRDNZ_07570, partial [Streptosporangiaceae bacterium]
RYPTRPFRQPLLAAPRRRGRPAGSGQLTEAEADVLMRDVRVLLDSDRPAEAILLLEDGIERADRDAYLRLRLRHFLGATLFYAGEYTRAASLLDDAGREYRRYLPPEDRTVLDCAYHAGHAYAAIGKPDKALPQLRFYVRNADSSADEDEAVKSLESRFVIAQMLAAAGDLGPVPGQRGKHFIKDFTCPLLPGSRQTARF